MGNTWHGKNVYPQIIILCLAGVLSSLLTLDKPIQRNGLQNPTVPYAMLVVNIQDTYYLSYYIQSRSGEV